MTRPDTGVLPARLGTPVAGVGAGTVYRPPGAARPPGTAPSGHDGLRRDTLANILGRGSASFLAVAFAPVYLRQLGVEVYGLIGFAATLQVIIALLDLGLATTLNRELARLSARGDGVADDAVAAEQRDLTRTLETLYWLASAVIATAVVLLAPAIAGMWLRTEHLPMTTVEGAVRLMGLGIALQFPFALYEGGLLGLRRQVGLNVIVAAGAALRFAAVVAVLRWVSPRPEAFFAWQALVSLLQSAAARALLWRSLPTPKARPRFRPAIAGRVRPFAAGMAAISVTAAVSTQMDKLVVSKLLTLSAFGYYTLAWAVAGALNVLFVPFFQSVFPRFSHLVAARDDRALSALYHRSSQAVALLLLPAAAVLALFSREVMLLWTGSAEVAAATAGVLTLLAAGMALNGLMNVPYALQLASGWTTLTLRANVVAIALLFPAAALLVSRFGPAGAAGVWLAVNVGNVTFVLAAMHRRLLRGELRRWFVADVGVPLVAALAAAGAVRVIAPPPTTPLYVAAELALALGLAYAVACGATPVGRGIVAQRLRRRA